MSAKKNLSWVASVILAIMVGLLSGYVGAHLAMSHIKFSTTSSGSMDAIISSKNLRVGYIVFPPSVIKEPNADNPTGHMIDVARYIGAELGVKVSFYEATWATFVAGLQAKQYDVVVAPLFATPSRAAAVAFTKPLYYLGMAVIARRGDSRFPLLNELNKSTVTIAVNQGGANQRFAKRYFPNAQLTELSTADISQVLSEVVAGRADAAIADTWSVSKFAAQNKDVVQVLFGGAPLDVTAISWAVRPEDTRLLQFLDTSIEYLQTSGKMKQVEEQYGVHWLHLKREWVQE